MKIEQIEITGHGFSILVDVEVDYIDVPSMVSGETGSQNSYERQLIEIDYPDAALAVFIKKNDSLRDQVLKQVWTHLEKYGD